MYFNLYNRGGGDNQFSQHVELTSLYASHPLFILSRELKLLRKVIFFILL